jgi:hypothetical protein
VATDSAGLPLLAVELLRAVALGLDLGTIAGAWPEPLRTLDQSLPGDLPDAVVAAIRVAFRRLSPEAQRVLVSAAVLGDLAAPAGARSRARDGRRDTGARARRAGVASLAGVGAARLLVLRQDRPAGGAARYGHARAAERVLEAAAEAMRAIDERWANGRTDEPTNINHVTSRSVVASARIPTGKSRELLE